MGPNNIVTGSGGVLYGTTTRGGTTVAGGTVFSLQPPASPGGPWTETVIHNFGIGLDGSSPFAGVVVGPGGVLFGATQYSGTEGSPSTAFVLTPPTSPGGPWSESGLHYFNRGDGRGTDILSGLVVGRNQILYGTTYAGGTSHGGTVYALQPYPTRPASAPS